MTGQKKTITIWSGWQGLKNHLVGPFSGDLSERHRVDESQDERLRRAYRYILLLLAAILLPINAYNLYIGSSVPAAAGVLLLGLLLVNILLLSMNREAVLSLSPVMLLTLSLVTLSIYYSQDYSLYLLFPLLATLPALLRTRWTAFFGVLFVLLIGSLVLTRYDAATALVIGSSMALTWLVSAWLTFAAAEQSRRLRRIAVTDPLTGAYNRRYLELRAQQTLDTWWRHRRPAALLLVDIDHFKDINDKFGHAVGDDAIKKLVDIISHNIRSADILCRFGGEEFILLLTEVSADNAQKVAEKVRHTVEVSKTLPGDSVMTVSVGVAAVSLASDLDHWLNLADTALYLAKSNGRNRVETADSTVIPLGPIAKRR